MILKTKKIPVDTPRKHRRRAAALFIPALLVSLFASSPAGAASPAACFSNLGGTDAAALADPAGRILHAVNENRPCVPASTLKILTALAALRSFEPSYRFPTLLFLGADHSLHIKGFGDPRLTSEVLAEMAADVAAKIGDIRHIVVDHSYFSDVTIPGTNHSTNPYDAPVGALSANFNTVKIAAGSGGELVSAEEQTPLISYAKTRLKRLGTTGNGRYAFLHDAREAALYTGELLSYFLRLNGVSVTGTVKAGDVPPGAEPLMTFLSPWTIEDAVEEMLEFSSNFIANQLFLAIGAKEYGPPGTLEKSLRRVRTLGAGRFGLTSLKIVEGSGISRENRISPSDMLKLLQHFAPYRHLLTRQFNIPYKTGTLKGIRTRAGYLEPVFGRPHPFALFITENIERTDNIVKCLGRASEHFTGPGKAP
jgi:D-alanyl-D-alanine carboxypeptidase/D-alanyl-D-alanine-endopeptidase (penicillin-binding protein 4)